MTTDAARAMGLTPGVDYVSGDAFPNNPNLHTAKFLGDPIQTTIKAIDKGGFYTASGKPRWSYLNDIPNVSNWNNLDYNGKVQTIAEMYRHEGGNGSLMKNSNSSPLAFSGGGGPRSFSNLNSSAPVSPMNNFNNLTQLGNITTQYGEADKDTNFHTGVDVANKEGTPIPKLGGTGGVVEAYKPQDGDYGNQLVIRDDNGNREYYSHLHQAMVRPGQRVAPGQPVAQMGSTGNTWSPSGGDPSHLHFEVKDPNGNFMNPTPQLNQT